LVASGRLLATHGATVTLKVILCQRFGEYVSNLVFSVDREYLDKSFSNMLAKMMIANIDVLGSWTKLGKPSEFQCARVILKYLAVYIRLVANDLEFSLPHFL
jgi:hypothetical protein